MKNVQPGPILPTPEQCRAARAVLSLSIVETCKAISMGTMTLQTFEAGGEVRASSAARLRELFEARGVTFSPDGRGLSW